MLKIIFYFFSLIAILYEIHAFSRFDKLQGVKKRILDHSKQPKTLLSTTDNSFIAWMILYFIWTGVGLFTAQWFMFSIVIILSLLSSSNWLENSKIWHKMDCVVCIVVYLYIIANAFHLHINTFQKVLSLFV